MQTVHNDTVKGKSYPAGYVALAKSILKMAHKVAADPLLSKEMEKHLMPSPK